MNSKILTILPILAVLFTASILGQAFGNTSGNPRDPPTYNRDGFGDTSQVSENPREPPTHYNHHFGFTNDPICGLHICGADEVKPSGSHPMNNKDSFSGNLESKHIATE